MQLQSAFEEYSKAQKAGLKDQKERLAAGKEPGLQVLEQMVSKMDLLQTQSVGYVEIPTELIVGTRTAGRTTAFTASFLPVLDKDTEFAAKWTALCAAHLSDEGIREPITCVEYLGKFYVQEGNKRVSVLRWFGAPRIPAIVTRVLPPLSAEPHVRAYYEFLEFYQATRLYRVQYRTPGDYKKLLSRLGKEPGEHWTERERRAFSSAFHQFADTFEALGGEKLDLLPEEALLVWLRLYPFKQLQEMSSAELKQTLVPMWDDFVTLTQPEPVKVETEAITGGNPGIISRIISSALKVAFIHPADSQSSTWVKGHEEGRRYIEEVFGDKIAVTSYFHANTEEETDRLLSLAVAEGAQVVFTTTPQMGRATLRSALKHSKVKFLNCSVNVPYPSYRSYYCRVYEAKFITGAIAGAMAKNDRIGYVGSYPIYGVPASVNAFALGAQMTNPRAKIELRWSCLPGNPVEDFVRQGIRVISNRDVPTAEQRYLDFCNYGTYLVDEDGKLTGLGSPVWVWGKCYEHVIRSILTGAWNDKKNAGKAVNYWWGMDSGVIDLKLSEHVPEGVRSLANMLTRAMRLGLMDPFARHITAQDGTVINDGSRKLSPDEILRMDWLCHNVVGELPAFEDVLPYSKNMVRELGVYRDAIPPEKEGSL